MFDGCETHPCFNYEGETTNLYCVTHKLENMVDIKSKTCIFDGCKTHAIFNYEGETKRLYCSTHKLENMINIKHKTCIFERCKKIPTFNNNGEIKALYCATHKLDGMINVIDNKCIGQGGTCSVVKPTKKYDGYCAFCFTHTFPNDPRTLTIRTKSKEILVRNYINENFKGFIHDTPIWTGNCECVHRRRIDHRCLINNTLLCVETDEFQHHCYKKEDEEARLNDLFMIHGGKMVFIRFNPDKYKNKMGKKVNPLLKTRLNVLKDEINKQVFRILSEENKDLVEVIYLYYDEK